MAATSTPQEAVNFHENYVQESEGAYNDVLVEERNRIQLFLRELGYPDPEDEEMITRMKYVKDTQALWHDGQPMDNTKVFSKPSFFSWAQRKLEIRELVNYVKFLLNQIDLSNPVSAEYWNNKYPWLYVLRMKQVEAHAQVQKRLAYISIKGGPSTEEDFKFLLHLKNGDIGYQNSSLADLFTANDSDRYKAATYLNNFSKNMGSYKTYPVMIDKLAATDPLAALYNNQKSFEADSTFIARSVDPTKTTLSGKIVPQFNASNNIIHDQTAKTFENFKQNVANV